MTKKYGILVLGLALAGASCGDAASIPPGDVADDSETARSQRQALSGDSDQLIPPRIKKIGATAAEYLGYYANAKDALEIATFLGQVLGIFEAKDPDWEYNQLKAEIQNTGRAISWIGTMQFIDPQRGKATWAIDRIPRANGVLPEGGNEDQSSGEGADTLLYGSAFLRPHSDDAVSGVWTGLIPDRAGPDQEGLVYDWRLGAPALLEVIAFRIHVIAAMDPNFRWNDRYDQELIRFRDALQFHYGKMLGGVKCGSYVPPGSRGPLPYWAHICADIHTGAWAGRAFDPPITEDAELVLQRLRTDVMRAMPLFEMRSMIDMLNLYIGGAQDLTQATGEIRLSQATDLCLDVTGGNPNPQTPVGMWWCNSTDAQRWVYDRPSGRIYNPVFGLCLDVIGAEPFVGKGVQTYWCHGGDNQRWSYDPVTRQLQNGMGTVLYAQSHPRDPVSEGGFFGPVIHAAHMALEMLSSSPTSPPIAGSPVVTVTSGGSPGGRQWLSLQNCANPCTAQGSPMSNACNTSCASEICAVDPYCCQNAWDSICVSEVASVCGLHC